MSPNQISNKKGSQFHNGKDHSSRKSNVCFGHSPKCHKPDQVKSLHSKFLVAILILIFVSFDSVTSLISPVTLMQT